MNKKLTKILDEDLDANAFSGLVKETFEPYDSEDHKLLMNGIGLAAGMAIEHASLVGDDPVSTVNAFRFIIDKHIKTQIHHIIHHEDFREMEGRWRGLKSLVFNIKTDDTLKLKVLNVSKKEVQDSFNRFSGINWDHSPMFKKLYEEEYGTAGGKPFGCVVGDYYFGHGEQDVKWLEEMARIAAAAHFIFIAGASPALFNMDSWRELSDPRDITKILQTNEYIRWKSLRNLEESKYIALTMPRILGRLPYSAKYNPVMGFDFEEDISMDGDECDKFVWINSAYALARNICNAFIKYGWCSQIRGARYGGKVDTLPQMSYGTDYYGQGVDLIAAIETAMTDNREMELSRSGLIPLMYWAKTGYAVFLSSQSLHAPKEYRDKDATINANLAARITYMFPVCRFAHYLKCIVRDKIGSFSSREEIETALNDWIGGYVVPDPNASTDTKARHPLSKAKVVVSDDKASPGYYRATFYLKPHYQIEGLTVSLKLDSALPMEQGK
jgi:type VI secretion system protein ImpC